MPFLEQQDYLRLIGGCVQLAFVALIFAITHC